MVQRSSDDVAAFHGRVREFLTKLRDVVERLGVDNQGANDRFVATFESISSTLSEFGVIEINISTNRITHEDAEVYRSEARTKNLAFDLFRQGIRQLKFLPGMESDELYTLAVQFSEFSATEEIDEDINTSLWREDLPHIEIAAVDIFTEKVFMADPDFMERFTMTIDQVVPGLMNFDPEVSPEKPDLAAMAALVDFELLDRADLEERKLRKAFAETGKSIRGSFQVHKASCDLADHLVQQVCALALHSECPLQDAEIRGVLSRILSVYIDDGEWNRLATVMRTLREFSEHRVGLEPFLSSRLERIGQVAFGRDTLEMVAHSLSGEETNFISWSRWFFTDSAALQAPQLLELVNGCSNSVGKELIKSLLRRLNSSSMEAWAERLRDPNGGIVEEVIDVIVESELGEQAKSLFLETLRHQAPRVRVRSVEVLAPYYDSQVREAVLPMITDPDAGVRLAVLGLIQSRRDKSITPYLVQVARSDEVFGYGEDELRTLFETIALLGAANLTDLFEERLALSNGGSVVSQIFGGRKGTIEDLPIRRAAVSGLAILGDSRSVGLIRKVHRNAELSLAAHCEVALKMAERVRTQNAEHDHERVRSIAHEDIAQFAGLMGESLLFRPSQLGLSADKVLVEAEAADPGPTEPPKSKDIAVSAEATASHEHLYVEGEQLSAPRRLLGSPTMLTGGEFRVLDVQMALVSLSATSHERQTVVSRVAVVERNRQAGTVKLDDILQSYISADEPQSNSKVDEPSPDTTVDAILAGYLEKEVPKGVSSTQGSKSSEQDLEALLLDYANEDGSE